jgi:pimeloyl-ACP methyl ester carboxylesterase
MDAALTAFCTSHPQQHAEINGRTWTYITGGSGPEALLLLPGVHGFADARFQYIEAMERHHRVISPNYPAKILTLAELADALVALMEHEGIQQAHVLGGSFGALIAQALLQRHQGHVLSVILEHGLFPRRRLGLLLLPLLMIASAVPTAGLHLLLHLVLLLYQWQMAHGRAFWAGYFRRVIASVSRHDVVARLSVLKDFHLRGRASLARPKDWSGRALVVIAEMDVLLTPQDRKALLSHYAGAEIQLLEDASHLGAAYEPERYLAIYKRFLGMDSDDLLEPIQGGSKEPGYV